MNNIFVCTSLLNSIRGTRRFGLITGDDPHRTVYDGITGFESNEELIIEPDDTCVVNNKVFEPPQHAKGAISRACLYMISQYPSLQNIIEELVLDPETMHMWHRYYRILPWETQRAYNIASFGYPLNHYCIGKTG